MFYDHITLLGAVCFALLIVYTAGYIVYNVFFHPLRSFPGRTAWAATRIPLGRSWISGTHHLRLLELHERYGDAVRTGPNEVSYTHPQAWRDVYAHRKPGQEEFGRDALSMPPSINGVRNLIEADRHNHARFRRLLAHAFSDKGLREQQPLIMQYVDQLVARLQEEYDSDGERLQDMATWYNWTTFDLIGELAFGDSFQCLATRATHPWIGFLFGNVKAIPVITLLCRYGVFALLLPLLPKRIKQPRQEHYEFAKEKVLQRVRLGKERGDFLNHVLKYDDDDGDSDGKGMTLEELVSNASLLVLAGSETTATLLAGVTYFLLLKQNMRVLETLLAEIRGAFATDADISIIAVARLQYLGAVLDEALRIYPPVPLGQQRVVPAPGETVLGRWLPGGTVITVQHYAAYHSPSNFHSPSSFIPERHLASTSSNNEPSPFVHDNLAVLQPFGVGPRNCIGRNLAMIKMRLVLAKVLYHFDLELDEARCRRWAVQQKVYLMWEKNKPLLVRLKRRTVAE